MPKLDKAEYEVLQCIHDLQLVGRPHPRSLEDGFDGMPLMFFDPVPLVALLGELFRPGSECMKGGDEGLDRVLRRLEIRGAIEHSIGAAPVQQAHVRPDGKIVELSFTPFRNTELYTVSIDERVIYRQSAFAPYRRADRFGISPTGFNDRYRIDVFGMTSAGISLLIESCADCSGCVATSQTQTRRVRQSSVTEDSKPCWNVEHRELYYRGVLVAKYDQTAVNQACLLAAFEKAEWLFRIEDPFSVKRADRIRQTVRDLNKKIKLANERRIHKGGRPPIHFGTVDSACAVTWKPVE